MTRPPRFRFLVPGGLLVIILGVAGLLISAAPGERVAATLAQAAPGAREEQGHEAHGAVRGGQRGGQGTLFRSVSHAADL